ncbi:hypothetical protein ABZV31_18285 [Streptomyces sp. NPDC005202]|uniref:hypothetical protein n=1 Tax=Streptomyces sp. NPDC005202 TaxID=3157021 RepID=UPI00339DC193
MRLCTPLSLCLAAAAVFLPGSAHADPRPTCAGSDDRHFPISSRIHGGPDAYGAGGGYGTFSIDLTNTTARTCASIHPVVVLVDAKHALKATQPRLEFYDGGRPHPVRFETTDQDELVGPFDAKLPGFTVGPGKTVTVKVRLALTSDAQPNEVTAKAAVVQRHNNDGDWVGQSNDYRFRIDADADTAPDPEPDAGAYAGTAPDPEPDPGADPGTDPDPEPDPGADPGTDPAAASTAPDDRLPFADELARTGLTTAKGVITATAFLLALGGTLALTRRRR